MVERPQPGPVLLGSASPRRRALLDSIGVAVQVVDASVDESDFGTGEIGALTATLARAKFAAAGRSVESSGSRPDRTAILLTADTLVALGGRLLPKPADRAEAQAVLTAVSGATLDIVTSVRVGPPGDIAASRGQTVRTRVAMAPIAGPEITRYLDTERWADKAAGLALQGQAGRFVARVEGCWSNVIGLPLCAVTGLLSPSSGVRCHPDLCGSHSVSGEA